MSEERGRIVGIGGIFFKSADPKNLRAWYAEKLGIGDGGEYTSFDWRTADDAGTKQMTAWSVFARDTKYFAPSDQSFMINYIVDGLDELLAKLESSGVRIDPKRDDTDYGRFAWIFDADGNKVELWEPPKDVKSS